MKHLVKAFDPTPKRSKHVGQTIYMTTYKCYTMHCTPSQIESVHEMTCCRTKESRLSKLVILINENIQINK